MTFLRQPQISFDTTTGALAARDTSTQSSVIIMAVKNGPIDVRTLGIIGDGTPAYNAQINAAVAAGLDLFFPPTTAGYNITGTTLYPIRDGQRFVGQDTTIFSTATTGSVMTCPFGRVGLRVQGLRLAMPLNATAGAVADFSGVAFQDCKIDLAIDGGYDGLLMGACSYGTLRYNVQRQVRNSVVLRALNAAQGGRGELQWEILGGSISGQCGGVGLGVYGTNGASQVTLQPWHAPSVFATSGRGIEVIGTPSCPINDLQINSGLAGETGDSCFYGDYQGGVNNRVRMTVELAGRSATGQTLSTPPSGKGAGFEFSNTCPLAIVDGIANNCSYEGLYTGAALTAVNGTYSANGLAGVAGRKSNIFQNAGKMRIGDATLDGRGLSDYGVYTYDGSKLAIGTISAGRNNVADVGAFANIGSVQGPLIKQVYP